LAEWYSEIAFATRSNPSTGKLYQRLCKKLGRRRKNIRRKMKIYQISQANQYNLKQRTTLHVASSREHWTRKTTKDCKYE
jgi:hypothetical protein